jgi:hypothetical protein
MTSIAKLLRQRQQHKTTHRLGVSADSLLNPPQRNCPPPQSPKHVAATINFEKAKSEFTIPGAVPNRTIASAWKVTVEPEEVKTQSHTWHRDPFNLIPAKNPTGNPAQNVFFQLAPSVNTTDEQMYEEFKREYLVNGTEEAFRKYRKTNYKKRRSRMRKYVRMSRRRK